MPFTFEEKLGATREEYGFPKQTITKIIKELNTKECFAQDGDDDRKLECLCAILMEKSETSNKADNQKKGEYRYSHDYTINAGLFEVYGEAALRDLSPRYINYLVQFGIHPELPIYMDGYESYHM